MRKVFILLLFSLLFASAKIEYSSFNDGTNFMNKSGASYFDITKGNKLGANYSETTTGTNLKRDISLNYDWNYQEDWSEFIFLSYTENSANGLNKTRVGIGLAYTPFIYVNVFPYRHKVSYAVISENGNLINSFRYKLKGYYKKFGFDMTAFILSYTWNIDITLGLEVSDNTRIIYKEFMEEYNGIYKTSSVGIEMRF